VECARKHHREWTRQNADHLKEYRGQPEFKRKRQIAVKKAIERSPRSFLHAMLHHNCKMSAKRKAAKGKLNPVCLDVQIDADYLMGLWEKQGGRCALTAIPMAHQFNNPNSASVDRICSNGGYVPGNVQLLCKWVNRAKNNMSNSQFRQVLLALKAAEAHRTSWEIAATHTNDLADGSAVAAFFQAVLEGLAELHWGQRCLRVICSRADATHLEVIYLSVKVASVHMEEGVAIIRRRAWLRAAGVRAMETTREVRVELAHPEAVALTVTAVSEALGKHVEGGQSVEMSPAESLLAQLSQP
jgi:hypothetical protein